MSFINDIVNNKKCLPKLLDIDAQYAVEWKTFEQENILHKTY